MDGTRKVLAVLALMVLLVAFTAPSMAQRYGGTPQTGQQAPQAGQQAGQQQPSNDLLATMQNMSDISIFLAAVKSTGYDRILSQGQGQGQGPIIVFAPTNKAIQQELGISDASTLIGNRTKAKSLVENNIVTQVKQPAQGAKTITMTAISGKQITATKSDSAITANGINASRAIMAKNGILIVTDGIVGK